MPASKRAKQTPHELTPQEQNDARLWDASVHLAAAETALRFAGRPNLLRKVSKLHGKVIHVLAVEAPTNPRLR
jgi:hypothetical protein